LNTRARAVRQAAGELGEDHRVQTERGERAFAAGDRVYFLRNERGLGVKNGTLGTVTWIEGFSAGHGDRLTVWLDDGRTVGFDVKDYAHIAGPPASGAASARRTLRVGPCGWWPAHAPGPPPPLALVTIAA
jgi:hypothetical protein